MGYVHRRGGVPHEPEVDDVFQNGPRHTWMPTGSQPRDGGGPCETRCCRRCSGRRRKWRPRGPTAPPAAGPAPGAPTSTRGAPRIAGCDSNASWGSHARITEFERIFAVTGRHEGAGRLAWEGTQHPRSRRWFCVDFIFKVDEEDGLRAKEGQPAAPPPLS